MSGFQGEVTSVESSLIQPGTAQETQNIDVQDGRIRVRKGHTLLSAAPGAFTSSLGFSYVAGYDDGSIFAEEIISIEARTGPTYRPYSVNVSDGVRTVIKDGVTDLTLTNAPWHILSHQGYAYCFARGGLVYRHIVGDVTSWDPVDVAEPATPSGLLPYAVEITEPIIGINVDNTISFAAAVGGDVTDWAADAYDLRYGGGAPADYHTVAFDSVSGDNLQITHAVGLAPWATPTSGHTFGVEIDIPAGEPTDWSASDKIYIPVRRVGGYKSGQVYNASGYPMHYYQYSPKVFLKDTSGSFIELTTSFAAGASVGGDGGSDMVYLTCELGSMTRTAIEKIRLVYVSDYEWDGSAYVSPKVIEIQPIQLLGITGIATPTPSADAEPVRFGVAAYNEETGQESEEVLESDWLQIDSGPTRWFTELDVYLGNELQLNLPTIVTPATVFKLYVQFQDENIWRLIGSKDSEAEVAIEYTSAQLRAFPARFRLTVNPVGNVTCAVAHGGSVVWGGEGGRGNIKISAIGNPPKIYSETDDLDDDTRGATYTLADNFGDEPVSMLSVSDGLFIFGSEGVYAMQGTRPTGMTPPKRFTQGLGIISPNACAVFVDNGGNPSALYIDKAQQVWILQIVNGVSEYGLRAERFDVRVEGLVRNWLTQTDSPSSEDLTIIQDRANDAVNICYQTRMLVLSRRNLLQNQRQWVRHVYPSTWKYFTAETEKFWSINSTGQIHQLMLGSTDNGTAISSPFWKSGDFAGQNRRVARVAVEREDMSKPLSVEITSTRSAAGAVTSTTTISASTRYGRFGPTQQGFRHSFKVNLTDITAVITRVVIEEYSPSSRRLNT
jgi:hypothetical protein